MRKFNVLCFVLFVSIYFQNIYAQKINSYLPDNNEPRALSGYKLVWSDEFNYEGKPNSQNWKYEQGFVRNEELQWYQSDNANCKDGVLIIEGRRDTILNPNYDATSSDWKKKRRYAYYSASSIKTSGLQQWKYGRFEIRARIDISKGSWPAIWTLGKSMEWPACGEIDILEFYRVSDVPTILANFAWGTATRWVAKWDGYKTSLSNFLVKDPEWDKKFHVWRMDWNSDSIALYLDDELLNTVRLSNTINNDGTNPFLQEHYLLLNLALGSNGGDPSQTKFPLKYEVDYARVYQVSSTNTTGVDSKYIRNYEKPEIYPIPARSSLYIKNHEEPSMVSVLTITGSKVFSQKASKEINLSGLINGVYILNIEGYRPMHFTILR